MLLMSPKAGTVMAHFHGSCCYTSYDHVQRDFNPVQELSRKRTRAILREEELHSITSAAHCVIDMKDFHREIVRISHFSSRLPQQSNQIASTAILNSCTTHMGETRGNDSHFSAKRKRRTVRKKSLFSHTVVFT